MEIACAQLCGLGHYRMRGYLYIQTQEEFNNWIIQQEATIAENNPPPALSDSSSSTSASTIDTTTQQGVAH
jgi:cytochrome c oxidase subunit 2